MAQKNMKICPICQGKKVVEEVCECAMEWRGTQRGDDWEDCLCTPEQRCTACQGTGFVQFDN